MEPQATNSVCHPPERATISRRHAGLQGDESGATALVGFIIALAVFSIALLLVIHVTGSTAPSGDTSSSDLRAKALDALGLTLQDPGFTTSGSTAWNYHPDALDRFGLALPNRPNVLDYNKIQKLRDAKMTADPTNGIADYPEVRAALGIPSTYDFHLRTYPIFLGVEDAQWAQYEGIRVAYVAHGDRQSSPTGAASATYTWNNGTNYIAIDAKVTNLASAPTIYKVSFDLQQAGGAVAVDDQYTTLLDFNQTQTVEMRWYQLKNVDGSNYNVTASLMDPYGNILSKRSFTPVNLPKAGTNDYELLVDGGQFSFAQGNTVQLFLDHYDSLGGRSKTGISAILSVRAPNGTEVVNTTVSLPKNKALPWDCPAAACSSTGDYTVKLMTTSATRVVTDHVYVASSALFQQSLSPDIHAKMEMSYLQTLFKGFHNYTYSAATPQGDVFIDTKSSLSNLVDNLGRYQILIVGGHVKQNAMTSADTKYGIADWVKAGGHLVVLGTASQNTQWLQPLYASGVSTANGGISAPDPTNPILHTPEELSYSTYNDQGTAWKLKDAQYYTHVLAVTGTSGNSQQDTMAVSNPGAFGNGSVVLTSYIPSQLTNPQDNLEALKFLNNMVVHSYNMVFIDFGPQIPSGVTVASASRVALVPHPSLPDAQVEVRAILYMWKG